MAVDLSKVVVKILQNQMHILRIIIFNARGEYDAKDLYLEIDDITNETNKLIKELEKPE